ncbi:MAG: hypothetical protein JNK56_27290 [Myxococcales bacterium]|nr:hypothetical protein [Myxococcales bacterium]
MRTPPGSLYKVGGRRYVDSQGLLNVAGVHEVVPTANGWRVMAAAGAVHCALMEGRAALPRQRGALYELSAEGGASLKTERSTWLARGLVEAAGTFETWPGEPARAACNSCGSSCGCGPCRQKHAHHEHEEHG